MRRIDIARRAIVLGFAIAGFHGDCFEDSRQLSETCKGQPSCESVAPVTLSEASPVTVSPRIDRNHEVVELRGCDGGTFSVTAADDTCAYVWADPEPGADCAGFGFRVGDPMDLIGGSFSTRSSALLCAPDRVVQGVPLVEGRLIRGAARLAFSNFDNGCRTGSFEVSLQCPAECVAPPVDTLDVTPASEVHVAAPPLVVSPPANQSSGAAQVVACPGDEIVATPPAGATVAITPSAEFGIGGESSLGTVAGAAARYQVPKPFGLLASFVVGMSDPVCSANPFTVGLFGGDGRSYAPDAPVDLGFGTPIQVALHPLTPLYFALPDDSPRTVILVIGGAAVEAGASVAIGVGSTVDGVPSCHPSVASLCDDSLRGAQIGPGAYAPIIVEIPADAEGELFLSEGESVLKAIEAYDDCPDVTLTATLVAVAEFEDCAAAGDEDDNGTADCDDPACENEDVCNLPETEADCDNGVDDDGDGPADCDDEDCAVDPACNTADTEVDCDNRVDDDGDGRADCGDEDCAADPVCSGSGCPPAESVELVSATLVDTTGMLNNFVCVEDACGGLLSSFWDEIGAEGSEVLYGYSAPFAAPDIVLPIGVDVRIRQYSPVDMFNETGAVACMGDRFYNFSYETAAPAPAAPLAPDATPLVVFAGLQPEEFGPPYRFPADSTCPGGDCEDYLPRFFVLEEECENTPGSAMVRVFNASPRKPSVTVRVTPRPEESGAPFELATALPWGEASDWVALPPTVGSRYIAEWSFVDAGTGEEFQNVLAYFPRVDRTAAEVPLGDTCSTIIVAFNELGPEREHAFLVMESPRVCGFWNNRDGAPTATWPECE